MKRNVNDDQIKTDERTEEATEPMRPRGTIVKAIAIALIVLIGVCGVAAGIILPIVLGTKEFTDKEGVNPTATITLSNGMKLEFDIYEDKCPNAATNFIYLASIGYFDGTIIFDGQQGFVRFGGWTAGADGAAVHRGDDDTNFTDKITLTKWTTTSGTERDYNKNKFGYRLKEDTAKKDILGTVGTLGFCYERSATEFALTADENYSTTVPGDDGGTTGTKVGWKVAPFGFAKNEKTIENIMALGALGLDDGTAFAHSYWRAPLGDDGLIKIKSVKVVDKSASKWKDFDFVRYVNSGGMKTSSWNTGSQKKSGN